MSRFYQILGINLLLDIVLFCVESNVSYCINLPLTNWLWQVRDFDNESLSARPNVI